MGENTARSADKPEDEVDVLTIRADGAEDENAYSPEKSGRLEVASPPKVV
jgi:hypothetical protein